MAFLATLPPLNWVTYELTRIEENNLGKEPKNVVSIAQPFTIEEEVSSNGGRTLFYLPEVRIKFSVLTHLLGTTKEKNLVVDPKQVNEFLLEDAESGARFNFKAELR